MNFRKHLFGFAIFSFIVGCAILINHFLNIPDVRVPYAPLYQDETAETKEESLETQITDFKVRLVSLDFINKQSYTALTIERQPGQTLPEKLSVTTVFFVPGYPQKVWTSRTEIARPFVNGDRFQYVATGPCDWCLDSSAPKAGYFARVYVSSAYDNSSLPPDALSDHDIRTGIPVIVQSERGHFIP